LGVVLIIDLEILLLVLWQEFFILLLLLMGLDSGGRCGKVVVRTGKPHSSSFHISQMGEVVGVVMGSG
jgi:hypothetical protein